MRDHVTISYRGARYELGRGRGYYGIWPAGALPRSQPPEWWPDTTDGWYSAWNRFTVIEAPGTIVPVGRRTAPVTSTSIPAASATGPAAGGVSVPAAGIPAAGIPAAGIPAAGVPAAGLGAPVIPRSRALIAAALLAIGVGCGVAGLFPGYLAGASLAQQPAELVPHVIYLAAWAASALLILLGGARLRVGALLGIGTSIVTFGFFLADAGTAMAGGMHLVGAGLVLSLIGWLGCAAGAAMAFRLRLAGEPAGLQGYTMRSVLTLTLASLAAVGAAAAFAPSWDSFTLRAAAEATETVTAGNAFANPAPVIAGDVAVMVTLVAVVVAAALWRPVRLGAALLAGAIIPMAAQAISALVQVGETASPQQFGISPAQAAAAGLTIHSGLTPAFWIYCAFVVALIAVGTWMLTQHRRDLAQRQPFGYQAAQPGGWNPAGPAAAPAAARSSDIRPAMTAQLPAEQPDAYPAIVPDDGMSTGS